MKHFSRSVAVLLAFVLVACQGPGTEAPPVDDDPLPLQGVITGKLQSRSGEPSVGAQVTLRGSITPMSVSSVELAAVGLVTTNAAGEFAFNVEEEGEYTLTALLGNEGAFSRVTVSRGPDGTLSSTPVSLQSAELGGVSGKVARAGPGAWAFLLGTSFLASTDATGSFVISGVPAGTYDLAAGVLGAVGAPARVTVEAGLVTTVSPALEFGPTITGTQPDGFTYFDHLNTHEEAEFRVHGSGFGSAMGTSVVRYAGTDVTDSITSWHDDEIIIRLNLSGHIILPDEHLRSVTDFVLEVATVAGTSTSAPMGHYRGFISPSSQNYCEHLGSLGGDDIGHVSTYLVGSSGPLGATFTLSATNASLADPVTREPTSTATMDVSGCAPFVITRASPTSPPAYVTATIVTPEVVTPHLLKTLFWAPDVEFDSWDVQVGSNTLSGAFLDRDSNEPKEGDEHYSVRVAETCDWNDHDAAFHPLS